MSVDIQRQRIVLEGRIQGVGFRPFVYRLAVRAGVTGWVCNDTRGVTIEIQGGPAAIAEFNRTLKDNSALPPAAQISRQKSVQIEPIADEKGFIIAASDRAGEAASEVTADIATCGDCLREMNDPSDLRYRYPFINCTNCGPRYSIIKQVPYDRPNTTMAEFQMCARCAAQYGDVTDRRFHAQPVACAVCGPKIYLTNSNGDLIESDSDIVITRACKLILDGKIVAIKGIGGFHLAVDALNERAVRRLRQRKRRDHKPFAMMARSVEKIEKYAVVDDAAAELLQGPESPIVLLSKKKDAAIARPVAEGVDTFGFMLPYAPLHHLLFAEEIDGRHLEALVMTSGNISDEPLICDNNKALQRLGGVADAFLMHNRDIYRQVDDSVFQFVDGKATPLRRARGYVPRPVRLAECAAEDVFAAGADLKNTFCFVKANKAIVSEHIGDLADAEVYRHYIESVRHLAGLLEARPKLVVCDLHPGYLSSRYAFSISAARVHQVQHHWAHIASVLAEHHISGPVIGLAADGTGYGTDGAIWGCECLIASLEGFERFGHLEYYDLPGGDKATKQAVRPAISLLRQAFGPDAGGRQTADILARLEPDENLRKIIDEQLEKSVNTVPTSSLGRVFDAVAAMLGLGGYNHFDAELPMALEAAATAGLEDSYDFDLSAEPGKPRQATIRRTIRQIVEDINNAVSTQVIATKFHNTVAKMLVELAAAAREQTRLETAAVSGGVFCNRYLANYVIKLLRERGFRVLFNVFVPANDGGKSLGQAAIGTKLVARR